MRGNPDKIKGKGFKERPGNINRNGRPPLAYSCMIKELTDKGYKPPTKAEYYDMIGLLLSMTEADLKEFAANKDRPYWIRLIILDLSTASRRQKLMSEYENRLFGKASESVDVTTGGEKLRQMPDLILNLSDSALKKLAE